MPTTKPKKKMPTKPKKKMRRLKLELTTVDQRLENAREFRREFDSEDRKRVRAIYREVELRESYRDKAALHFACALLQSTDQEHHESRDPVSIAESAVTYADALVLSLIERPEAVSLEDAERALDELLALVPSGTPLSDAQLARHVREHAKSATDRAAIGSAIASKGDPTPVHGR